LEAALVLDSHASLVVLGAVDVEDASVAAGAADVAEVAVVAAAEDVDAAVVNRLLEYRVWIDSCMSSCRGLFIHKGQSETHTMVMTAKIQEISGGKEEHYGKIGPFDEVKSKEGYVLPP
jgi:hypothetical protein